MLSGARRIKGRKVGWEQCGKLEAAATTWTADEIRAAPNDGGAAKDPDVVDDE